MRQARRRPAGDRRGRAVAIPAGGPGIREWTRRKNVAYPERAGRVERGEAMGLRERLAVGRILLAPGVFDALTALVAGRAGAEAFYVSGASIAYTRFGRPDIGLVGMAEVAETLSAIRERVEKPLIVDADTGFGNALNVQRTVRLFERTGAAAIQLEDQTLPKRCGHMAGKTLVGAAEMRGKIHAALDARTSDATLIIARTDAIAVEGLEAALDRAESYAEAGADVLFVEAPQSAAQIDAITARLRSKAPLMANMVEGGRTPVMPADELEKLGYSLVIFPGGAVRALAATAVRYYERLVRTGTTSDLGEAMFQFAELQELLGTDEVLAAGRAYDAEAN